MHSDTKLAVLAPELFVLISKSHSKGSVFYWTHIGFCDSSVVIPTNSHIARC